mgnify:CR=1 FL=1
MSKIMILTDSCCDLPKEVIEELGIRVLPILIHINGQSYREIFDKSTKEIYELMMSTDEIPKHSQVSPQDFLDAYQEIYKEGYIIGHTGNYLSIKSKGNIKNINKNKEVIIKEIEYPYCIGE